MHQKTVVITGANSGIGEAAAFALAEAGAEVALVCRNEARAKEAEGRIRSRLPNAKLRIHLMDLSSFASVREGAKSILEAHPRIDVLLNNAGLYLPKRRETEDGLETTVQVNHFGPFLLTSLLVNRVLASSPARIINVSSDAHRAARLRFDDLQSKRKYGSFEAYATSKLMNILHVRALARRLDSRKVTANALHPGVVATGFAQDEASLFGRVARLFSPFFRTPEQGADTAVFLAKEPEGAESTGAYFVDRKKRPPSRLALDDEAAERLFDESERLTGAPAFPQASGADAGFTQTEVS